MGNYFARDDSLDPALNVVCRGLRGNMNFEHVLRSGGGTFHSLGSAYWHLKSEFDHDLVGSTQIPKVGLSSGILLGSGDLGENPNKHTPQEKSPVRSSNAPDNAQGRVVGTITGVLDVVIKTTARESVDPVRGI